jgi:hypothetical protein
MRCITITCPMIANSFSEEPQRYRCIYRSVEGRVPFLDVESIALALSLTLEWNAVEYRNPQ